MLSGYRIITIIFLATIIPSCIAHAVNHTGKHKHEDGTSWVVRGNRDCYLVKRHCDYGRCQAAYYVCELLPIRNNLNDQN